MSNLRVHILTNKSKQQKSYMDRFLKEKRKNSCEELIFVHLFFFLLKFAEA